MPACGNKTVFAIKIILLVSKDMKWEEKVGKRINSK